MIKIKPLLITILAFILLISNSFAENIDVSSSVQEPNTLVLSDKLQLLPDAIEFGDSVNALAVKGSANWDTENQMNFGKIFDGERGFVKFTNKNYKNSGHLGGIPTTYFFYFDDEEFLNETRVDFGFFDSAKEISVLYSETLEQIKNRFGVPLDNKGGSTNMITTEAFNLAFDYDVLDYAEWLCEFGAGYLKIEIVIFDTGDDYKMNIGAYYFLI